MSVRDAPPRWTCAGCGRSTRHETKAGKASPPDGWVWDGDLLCCPGCCIRGFEFQHASINADEPEPDVVALEAPDLTGDDPNELGERVFLATKAMLAAEHPEMPDRQRHARAIRAARAVMLADYAEVPFDRIARLLGVSLRTAKAAAEDGRRAFRRSIEDGGLPDARPIPRAAIARSARSRRYV